jgi:hypothetical protein
MIPAYRIVVAVDGARKFGMPTGVPGGIPYEGCQVLVIDESAQGRGDALVSALKKKAVAVRVIANTEVCLFPTKFPEIVITVALPRPNILCLGVGETYISEFLQRFSRSEGTLGAVAALPEFKFVDSRSDWWAIRHYDARRAGVDPTSLLAANMVGLVDAQAIGVAVEWRREWNTSAVMTFLSGDSTAEKGLRDLWSRVDSNAEVQRVGPNAVQARFKFGDPNSWLLVV